MTFPAEPRSFEPVEHGGYDYRLQYMPGRVKWGRLAFLAVLALGCFVLWRI
jgi:hypothetical protein